MTGSKLLVFGTWPTFIGGNEVFEVKEIVADQMIYLDVKF